MSCELLRTRDGSQTAVLMRLDSRYDGFSLTTLSCCLCHAGFLIQEAQHVCGEGLALRRHLEQWRDSEHKCGQKADPYSLLFQLSQP